MPRLSSDVEETAELFLSISVPKATPTVEDFLDLLADLRTVTHGLTRSNEQASGPHKPVFLGLHTRSLPA